MNLATGLKEARLNIPEPPGTPHADLVVIDDVPHSSSEEDVPLTQLKDQSQPDTGCERLGPYYPAAFNAEESSLFASSITALRSPTGLSNTDLPALSTLQDLAHSIHWGVRLARDTAACRSLVSAVDPGFGASDEIRSAAALLLGTAVHSNPDALDVLLSHRYPSEDRVTLVDTVLAALRDPETKNIVFKTRTVFLLSQLCQNAGQLRVFVHSRGLTTLLELFEPDRMTADVGKDKFRTKAANFIYDRILSGLGSKDGLATHSSLDNSAPENYQALIDGLEPWRDAFTQALKMYKIAGMSAEGLSSAANAANESITETNHSLAEALAKVRGLRN